LSGRGKAAGGREARQTAAHDGNVGVERFGWDDAYVGHWAGKLPRNDALRTTRAVDL